MNLLSFAVSTLATYRLTKLVVSDEITSDLRERWIKHFGDPEESKLAYLVTCPHCVGIYAGAGVALVDTMFPDSRIATVFKSALAMSAITGIIAERENSF